METKRLVLREWIESDRKPFAEMCADERVMEFFPATLSVEQSETLVDRIEQHFAEHGFGLWAVEKKDGGEFIGFIGLCIPGFEAHFTPCVEIGWRLAAHHWRNGYASEGAKRVLHHAFETLQLEEVVSMTTVSNERSRRVMERIGMSRSPNDDFEHPALEPDHPLRPHVLYRVSSTRR